MLADCSCSFSNMAIEDNNKCGSYLDTLRRTYPSASQSMDTTLQLGKGKKRGPATFLIREKKNGQATFLPECL